MAKQAGPPAQVMAKPAAMGARLDQKGKVLAEYVWLGGSHTTGGFDMRQKTRTLSAPPAKLEDLPVWNFDGSSTGQAPGHDSEVLLLPVAMFRDPFRRGDNIVVLCECVDPKMQPIPTNTRRAAKAVFDKKLDEEPWFGIEQEYSLFAKDGRTPIGWPRGGYPAPQGPYYCSAGTDCAFGRSVVEAHYDACVFAGVMISGINAETMPGQWEFQIGPCEGISVGDHLWMARYIMIRVTEDFKVNVDFRPKPIPGDWSGSGGHVNYSTKKMREKGGYTEIIKAIEKLGGKHLEHIAVYGEGNEKRLTGRNETSPIDKFSYGVANRGASIRIPRQVQLDGCGYLEDRRPAANLDPYVVAPQIFQTTCLG